MFFFFLVFLQEAPIFSELDLTQDDNNKWQWWMMKIYHSHWSRTLRFTVHVQAFAIPLNTILRVWTMMEPIPQASIYLFLLFFIFRLRWKNLLIWYLNVKLVSNDVLSAKKIYKSKHLEFVFLQDFWFTLNYSCYNCPFW